MYDEALSDLRNLYRGGLSKTGWGGDVRKEDVARWAELSELTLSQVFDRVGVELARDYAGGILTWEFCDAAANRLFGVLTVLSMDGAVEMEEPEQFWNFYLAFDRSETVPPERAEETAQKHVADFLAGVPMDT